jgi:hypothetical protein
MIDRYGIHVPTPILRREVRPVLRVRLELVAFFTGVSALSFWASMTW